MAREDLLAPLPGLGGCFHLVNLGFRAYLRPIAGACLQARDRETVCSRIARSAPVDLNQLLSHHQISLIRDADPSQTGPSLSDHYAEQIGDLRALLGVQSYEAAAWLACS